MRNVWPLVVGCLLAACSARMSECPSFSPASGPFANVTVPAASEPPAVWLEPERDVLLVGQIPVVNVYAETGGGDYKDTVEFEILGRNGSEVARTCDKAWHPDGSRGFATLNFECQHPIGVGLFDINVTPPRLGLSGATVNVPIRILKDPPSTPAPPYGWIAEPLARAFPQECLRSGENYEVQVDNEKLRFGILRYTNSVKIPQPLVTRMSVHHANVVKYVFEDVDGWLVMFDHGEFGGGIEWYSKSGGAPRSIAIRKDAGDDVSQNVNRAAAIDGVIYVLQGLSHMGTSDGQIASVWREHDHFTSRIIAKYRSEPVDWILQSDGTWLVLTWEAIWGTSRTGNVKLVARLPEELGYPSSLAQASDGSLYIGARSGVLRLTRTWDEDPRFAADWLMPQGSPNQECWSKWRIAQTASNSTIP